MTLDSLFASIAVEHIMLAVSALLLLGVLASRAADRMIDGIDLAPVLFGGAALPERPFFFYRGEQLAACRLGTFKLHFITQEGFASSPPMRHDPPLLFDLGRDPGERFDVAAEHPDVVARIHAAVHAHEAAMQTGAPQFD